MEELLAQLLQQRALQTKADSDAKHSAALQTVLSGPSVSEAELYRRGDTGVAAKSAEPYVQTAQHMLRQGAGLERAPLLGVPQLPMRDQVGPGATVGKPAAIPRRERIDALGAQQDWSTPEAQDLMRGMPPGDLASAKHAQELGLATPPEGARNYMYPNWQYGVQTDPATGDKSVQAFSPDLPYGTTDESGLRGMAVGGSAMLAHPLPGPADLHGKPVSLEKQFQNRNAYEAADIIQQRLQRLHSILSGQGDTPYL